MPGPKSCSYSTDESIQDSLAHNMRIRCITENEDEALRLTCLSAWEQGRRLPMRLIPALIFSFLCLSTVKTRRWTVKVARLLKQRRHSLLRNSQNSLLYKKGPTYRHCEILCFSSSCKMPHCYYNLIQPINPSKRI